MHDSPLLHQLWFVVFIVSRYLFTKLLHELFHKGFFLLQFAKKNKQHPTDKHKTHNLV